MKPNRGSISIYLSQSNPNATKNVKCQTKTLENKILTRNHSNIIIKQKRIKLYSRVRLK